MFVSLRGFKAPYHYLTLLVVSEFNEWKVMLRTPEVTIHGARQFSEAKAKDHALVLARDFIHRHKGEDLPVLEAMEWVPTAQDDWLVWHV
jgi:hypothetical protein